MVTRKKKKIFFILHSGSTLIKCGHCHQKLGLAHKEFLQTASMGFMQPLKSFLDGEMKSLTVNIFLKLGFLCKIFSSRKNDEH
jgi:hypothetical protein